MRLDVSGSLNGFPLTRFCGTFNSENGVISVRFDNFDNPAFWAELVFTAECGGVISVDGRMPGPIRVKWHATITRLRSGGFDITVGTNDCVEFSLKTTIVDTNVSGGHPFFGGLKYVI
jgi:hypothetical protein